MSVFKIHWRAFFHEFFLFAVVFAGFIGGAFGAVAALRSLCHVHNRSAPPDWAIPIAAVGGALSFVILAIVVFRKIPVPCPSCGGPGHLSSEKDTPMYRCARCGDGFGALRMELPPRVGRIARIAGMIALAPVVTLLVIILFGIGAPLVFGMFFLAYLVIGPFMQLLVRLVPQKEPGNQPMPWTQYLGFALSMVLRTGAVLAVFRFLLALAALKNTEPGNPFFSSGVDVFFGGCGLVYGIVSFVQDGLWKYRQVLAVRDIPTSTVASLALGLVEVRGTVRHRDNPVDPPVPGQPVLSFFWNLLGAEQYPGRQMLGTYEKHLNSFWLEDTTGRVLVDPCHNAVELRRPIISVFTAFFGRRSFEVMLEGHIERPSWYERRYVLQEGDTAHVIGTAETNPHAPVDATGSDRLVIRPREEAVRGVESLLQFLLPFSGAPRRTPHDIFVIADTSEAKARGMLASNFRRVAGLSLSLTLISAFLIAFGRSGI